MIKILQIWLFPIYSLKDVGHYTIIPKMGLIDEGMYKD